MALSDLFDRAERTIRILRCRPQRIPKLIKDRRAIQHVEAAPEARNVLSSLGDLRLLSHSDLLQLREVAVHHVYCEPMFMPQAGWTIIDVGANIGIYSAWCLSLMRRGNLLAIEAIPHTYTALLHNLDSKRNPGAVIECVNIAVARESGELAFLVDDTNSAVSRSEISIREDKAFESIGTFSNGHVHAETLDHVVSAASLPFRSKAIDVLKIDIEGMEVDCLAGASRTLSRTRRLIFEYHSLELRLRAAHILKKAGFREVRERRMQGSTTVGLSFWLRRP